VGLKLAGQAPFAGRSWASIGPGGIEIRERRPGHPQRRTLQSDRGELKFIDPYYDAVGNLRFNRTGGN